MKNTQIKGMDKRYQKLSKENKWIADYIIAMVNHYIDYLIRKQYKEKLKKKGA